MTAPSHRRSALDPPAARRRVVDRAHLHLVREVPVAARAETADEVLRRLRGRRFDAVDAIYIVDDGRLEAVVSTTALLAARPGATMGELGTDRVPTVGPDAHQEWVASVAVRYGVTSVPVVDDRRRLVGVVPAAALLGILRREHVEDLHRLAGIQREERSARSALEAPPARRARHRLPWLLVGLAGSLGAAFLMSGFERTLEANLAVAFFVPAVVYLADAIGTQTEAVMVRGLSLAHAPIGALLAGELRTGFLLGAALGAIAFPLVFLAFHQLALAGAVSLAIFAAGAAATGVGVILPWALARAGRDPAFGSGPLATIVQDVLSLAVYLGMVQLIVR